MIMPDAITHNITRKRQIKTGTYTRITKAAYGQ